MAHTRGLQGESMMQMSLSQFAALQKDDRAIMLVALYNYRDYLRGIAEKTYDLEESGRLFGEAQRVVQVIENYKSK